MATPDPSPELRIALAQIPSRTGEFDDNLRLHLAAISTAQSVEADVLAFGELSLTGYSICAPDLSGWHRDQVLDELAAAAGELTVIAGTPMPADHGVTNSAVVINGGEIVHRQDKVHLPGYPPFDERVRFRPGAELATFQVRGWRCAILICEDAWHLSMAERAAAAGTELAVHVAASAVADQGIRAGNRRGWPLVNAALALLGARFVAFANLTGEDSGVRFWGGSAAYRPDGTEHGSLSDEAGLLVVDLDRGALNAPGVIRRAPRAARALQPDGRPDADPPPPCPPG